MKLCTHPERKVYARGRCKPCYRMWLLATNPKAKAQADKTRRAYWLANREVILERQRVAYAASNGAERDRAYGYRLRDKYGITVSAYKAMLTAQGGVCAICGCPPKPHRRLAVDHSHKDLTLRGLLCDRCNQVIGLMGDSQELLTAAARFLAACGVEG